MTIQISIVIWTVICFIMLMIILRNLLFAPVLKVMDDRRKKIDGIKQKKAMHDKFYKENEIMLEAQKAEFIKSKNEEEKALMEKLRTQGKQRVDEAQKQRMADVDAYRIEMDNEYTKIVATVGGEMDRVSEIFADKIISNRV